VTSPLATRAICGCPAARRGGARDREAVEEGAEGVGPDSLRVGAERFSKLYGCEALAEGVELAGGDVDAAIAERAGSFEPADFWLSVLASLQLGTTRSSGCAGRRPPLGPMVGRT